MVPGRISDVVRTRSDSSATPTSPGLPTWSRGIGELAFAKFSFAAKFYISITTS